MFAASFGSKMWIKKHKLWPKLSQMCDSEEMLRAPVCRRPSILRLRTAERCRSSPSRLQSGCLGDRTRRSWRPDIHPHTHTHKRMVRTFSQCLSGLEQKSTPALIIFPQMPSSQRHRWERRGCCSDLRQNIHPNHNQQLLWAALCKSQIRSGEKTDAEQPNRIKRST